MKIKFTAYEQVELIPVTVVRSTKASELVIAAPAMRWKSNVHQVLQPLSLSS